MISLSIDDGCKSDVRVADLASKYEIKCTFYWPVFWFSLGIEKGYEPLDIDEAWDIAKEHEIGSHTITHRHLTRIPSREAMHEINGSKWLLEDMFNKRITKFCPPRGYTNPELTEYTLGIYDSQRLTKGKNLVHIHPDSGANDNTNWIDRYKLLSREEENIELWGHSYDFDRFSMWEEIENFLKVTIHGK